MNSLAYDAPAESPPAAIVSTSDFPPAVIIAKPQLLGEVGLSYLCGDVEE